jgi:basic amino acid/polyamine antiporter, APA family
VSALESTPTPRGEEATLKRRLGPFDGAAIVVSNVIGSGIFFVPMLVAGLGMVSTGTTMLGAWAFGGVLAFAGAMAYAELATLRPHAGGEYVYLRDAYGPVAAFMTGWTSFVAGFSGAIAATSVALAAFIGRFFPAAADTTPLLTIPIPLVPLVVTKQAIVAIMAIVLLSIVHFHANGRIVHNLLASAKVSLLLVFIAIGLGWGNGSFANIGVAQNVDNGATGWIRALVPIMFAYSGWNAAAYVAEEIKNPGRNVPLALGLGTLAVIAIYLALNVLYLYAMPIADIGGLLAKNATLTDAVAERLFGYVAGNLLAVFTIVSMAASISAMVLAGPRVYYAMARDHVFLESAGRVHQRYRTPMLSITAQAIWASILVLCGTLSTLVSYTAFSVVLFAGIAVSALFVLRRREPAAERPFKALGYPLAPGFFVVASAAMVVAEILRDPKTSLAGIVVILAGLPFYFLFVVRARRR